MAKNRSSLPAADDPKAASKASDNNAKLGHATASPQVSPIKDAAAAMPKGVKPGPKEAAVQVRNAEPVLAHQAVEGWDEVDEAVDESFPASDPSAKY